MPFLPKAQSPKRRAQEAPKGRPREAARPRRRQRPDPFLHRSSVEAIHATVSPPAAPSRERQELVCSGLGLMVKLGLVVVAGISLTRMAGAYQQRIEQDGEIMAVLDIERSQLAKARERFDALFTVDGEQRLIREQSQWIAPNRLRVVWQPPAASALHAPSKSKAHP